MFMMKWGTLRIQKMNWARHAAHAGMPMSINSPFISNLLFLIEKFILFVQDPSFCE